MHTLIALFVVALTLPLWAGALAAVVTFGFHLLLNAPWLLALGLLAPFVVR